MWAFALTKMGGGDHASVRSVPLRIKSSPRRRALRPQLAQSGDACLPKKITTTKQGEEISLLPVHEPPCSVQIHLCGLPRLKAKVCCTISLGVRTIL
jgi:hypothetical protein